jgi:ubiquinone/menaquinone biosynthesis C-methylase UbiE
MKKKIRKIICIFIPVKSWRKKFRNIGREMPYEVGTKNLENREIWLEKVLAKIPKGSKILDAGAGELQYKKYCKHLKYTAQDFGQYNGQGDEKGLHTNAWDNSKLDIVCDISKIPVKDKSFDAIMCIEVFEHLPNPVLAIEEFSRVIKPGGTLIITAPFASLTHFAPYHFSPGYNKYYYEKHLPDNGFEIVSIVNNGNYFEFIAQELRRLESIEYKYCKNVKLKDKEKRSIVKILKNLESASKNDTNSDEILCFGFQIIAKKVK